MPHHSDGRRGDPPPREPVQSGPSWLYLAAMVLVILILVGLPIAGFLVSKRTAIENEARWARQAAADRTVSIKLGDACLDRGTVELCLAFCADKAPNPEACRGRMWDRWIREQKP